jgi:N-acetyl-anhydromuramyl-L-alanine amidase AmpD
MVIDMNATNRPVVEMPPKPPIVTRTEWHARDPINKGQRHTPKMIVVHHSWEPTAAQVAGCGAEVIRSIQQYHMSKGWADIGYHFLIMPDGKIFEGRPVGNLGAHSGGTPPQGVTKCFGNTGTIGICCIGNYDTEEPAKPMLEAFIGLMSWLQAEFQINPRNVFGHCEAWSRPPKTCPGKHLFIHLFGRDRWAKLKF